MVNIAGSPWRQERVSLTHLTVKHLWCRNVCQKHQTWFFTLRFKNETDHVWNITDKQDHCCVTSHDVLWALTQVEPPPASSDVTPSNHHVMSSEAGGASCLTAVAIGGTQVLWDVPLFSVWGSAPNWTDWMLEDKHFHIYYVQKTNQHIQFLFSDTKWFSLVVRVGRWMFKADLEITSHKAALDQRTSSGTFSSWFQNQ